MKTRTFDNAVSDVFDATVRAIADCNMYIKRKDRARGKIIATTGFSLRSWGELITVEITSEEGGTKVCVTSAPQSQLFDWGKSDENEAMLVRKIHELLE